MDDLVRDDVVRECRVHDLAGTARRRGVTAPEVAEQQGPAVGRVEEGIRHLAGVGVDPQAVLDPVAGGGGPGPSDRSSQGTFERTDRPHRDRVDHLLVRLEIHLGRLEPARQQDVRRVEIDSRVGHRRLRPVAELDAAAVVLVDDRHEAADRPRLEGLVRDPQRDDVERPEAARRIDGEDAQRALAVFGDRGSVGGPIQELPRVSGDRRERLRLRCPRGRGPSPRAAAGRGRTSDPPIFQAWRTDHATPLCAPIPLCSGVSSVTPSGSVYDRTGRRSREHDPRGG